MPLPEPNEQEDERVKAGQEPSLGAKKPQESSNLVLAGDKEGSKPSGPAAVSSSTPQTLPAKKQGRIIHRKRSRVDAGETPWPTGPRSAKSADLCTPIFHRGDLRYPILPFS